MQQLCETCLICSWLPKQDKPRLYKKEPEASSPLVLVLDYLPSLEDLDPATAIADALLGSVQYTYSPVIRCESEGATQEELKKSSSRCAVWSHQLLPGRSVILSHPFGIRQMGILEEVKIGQIFISKAYGLVLPIKSLLWYYHDSSGQQELKVIKGEVNRMLKKMRLA